MKEDIHKYDDIINMPRHISKKHPQMSTRDRAAQFAPFAALTGHKERIVETERLTTEKKELDTCQQEIINNALQRIRQNIKNCPNVTITYFIPDSKKEGGKYITVIEHVKKIDDYENIILLSNGSIFTGTDFV